MSRHTTGFPGVDHDSATSRTDPSPLRFSFTHLWQIGKEINVQALFSRKQPGPPLAAESQQHHEEGKPMSEEPLVAIDELKLSMPDHDGWQLDLSGVTVIADDIGRAAVSRADARNLLAEYRAAVTRHRERLRRHQEELERQAVERDQKFRAQLHPGIPAGMFGDGVDVVLAQIQADKDADPRRRSMQEELWGRQFARRDADEIVTTYHPIQEGGER